MINERKDIAPLFTQSLDQQIMIDMAYGEKSFYYLPFSLDANGDDFDVIIISDNNSTTFGYD